MERKFTAKYEYSMIIVMALIWGFVGMNRIGIAFLFPIIVPHFHLNYFQAGLLISDTSGLWALSSWMGGILGDRYGKKIVFVPAMLWAAVMSASLGLAGGFAALLVIRGLIGLGDGVGASVGFSMIADISAPKRRGLNIGIFSGGYTLAGIGVGAVVITRLAKAIGWEWVYPVLNIGMVALTLFVSWFMVDIWRRQKTAGRAAATAQAHKVSPLEPLRYRGFYLIIIINVLTLTWLMLSNGFNALFLTKVHHFSPVLAGSVLAGGGIVGFLGQMICPAISDFIGRKPVIIACGLLSFVFTLLFLHGADYSPIELEAIASVIGFFAWGQMSMTVGTIIVEAVPERLRATAIGTSNFPSVIIGTFIMPALAGWAADRWGLAIPMLMGGLCMLLISVLMFFVPESAPRKVGENIALSLKAA